MRRVAPRFSIPPDPYYEVMSGSDLNITCVAVGSPMPYVKWKKDQDDVLPEGSTTPIGKNVLELAGMRKERNYQRRAKLNSLFFLSFECVMNQNLSVDQ